MSKKPRKPTGDMGNVQTLGSSGASSIEPFQFPNTKDEIEKKIANLFLKMIETTDIDVLKGITLSQNKENDLDFSLISTDKKYLLELTEFTPPGKMKGGYEKLAYSHNIGEQKSLTC